MADTKNGLDKRLDNGNGAASLPSLPPPSAKVPTDFNKEHVVPPFPDAAGSISGGSGESGDSIESTATVIPDEQGDAKDSINSTMSLSLLEDQDPVLVSQMPTEVDNSAIIGGSPRMPKVRFSQDAGQSSSDEEAGDVSDSDFDNRRSAGLSPNHRKMSKRSSDSGSNTSLNKASPTSSHAKHLRKVSTMIDENADTTLFAGKSFAIHGFPQSKIRELENVIRYHGGHISPKVSESTSFFVTTPIEIENSQDLEQIMHRKIPVVSEDYVWSVTNDGRVDDIGPFRLVNNTNTSTNGALEVNSVPAVPLSDYSSAEDGAPEKKKSLKRKKRWPSTSSNHTSHTDKTPHAIKANQMHHLNAQGRDNLAKYLSLDAPSDEDDDTDDEYYRRPLGNLNFMEDTTPSDSESVHDQEDTDRRLKSVPKVLDPIGSYPEVQERSPTGYPIMPEGRERIEWQSMLASVLTGEVLRSEKKRISGALNEKDKEMDIRYKVWMGVRARLRARVPEDEQKYIEEARRHLDTMLGEVTKFRIVTGSDASSPADQVATILKKVDQCESLFPSRKAMMQEKSIYSSDEFQTNYEALTSWQSTTSSLRTQILILQNWTGSQELDVTVPKAKISTETIDGKSTFIERLLKDEGLQKTFDKQTLTSVNELVRRAKTITIDNATAFARMGLPTYMEDLSLLINFPTRLMEECLKFQLDYADRLNDPTMLMVDQFLDDFRVALREGCRIKIEYQSIVDSDSSHWKLPSCIDSDYENVLQHALKFFFKLLHFKLKSASKAILFKEAEILEQEWEFLIGVCQHIDGGDLMVAEQFSSLSNRLLGRLMEYFNSQMRSPGDQNTEEMVSLYNKVLENVRLRHRKLLRFSRVLFSQFENSGEYHLTSESFPAMVQALIDSDHFLVYTNTYEAKGIYIIAESSLYDRANAVRELLCKSFWRRTEELNSISEYVLILAPRDEFMWTGRVVECPVEEMDFGVRSGRLRLATDGSTYRLASCKSRFQKSLGPHALEVLIDSKANIQSINRELNRVKRTAFRLADSIISSVNILRRNVYGRGCQELVENFFSFATEFGQRAVRYMDATARTQLNLMLIRLSIDWVGFICDDCIPNDRKTFRWAVIALEFAMMMTRGNNILVLSEAEFSLLRARVASCMTLLISQIDVMGARSHLEAERERERQEALRGDAKKQMKKSLLYEKSGIQNPYDHRNNTALSSVSDVRESWVRQLAELDKQRTLQEQEMHMIGKVLDNDRLEDRSLVFLAASSSNISIRWQQGRFIGGGSFGSVYLAVNLDSNDLMAVKEIRFQDSQSLPGLLRSIRDEMSVMAMLDHPNIVQYYGIEVHRDKVYIFMEFCQGGSLANLLEHGRIEDEGVVQFYTLQMLQGISYLHKNEIVHRDIKPDNILLDHGGTIKFVDFGAAKVLAKTQRTRNRTITTDENGLTGTPMYMSPEVITNDAVGRRGAMDIWSLGCCVIEMATGHRPWPNLDNEWAVMFHVVQGHPPLPDPSLLSELGIDFVRQCLTRDPNLRPSADELMAHPWIQEMLEAVDTYEEPHDMDTQQPEEYVAREVIQEPTLETVMEEAEPRSKNPGSATLVQVQGDANDTAAIFAAMKLDEKSSPRLDVKPSPKLGKVPSETPSPKQDAKLSADVNEQLQP